MRFVSRAIAAKNTRESVPYRVASIAHNVEAAGGAECVSVFWTMNSFPSIEVSTILRGIIYVEDLQRSPTYVVI